MESSGKHINRSYKYIYSSNIKMSTPTGPTITSIVPQSGSGGSTVQVQTLTNPNPQGNSSSTTNTSGITSQTTSITGGLGGISSTTIGTGGVLNPVEQHKNEALLNQEGGDVSDIVLTGIAPVTPKKYGGMNTRARTKLLQSKNIVYGSNLPTLKDPVYTDAHTQAEYDQVCSEIAKCLVSIKDITNTLETDRIRALRRMRALNVKAALYSSINATKQLNNNIDLTNSERIAQQVIKDRINEGVVMKATMAFRQYLEDERVQPNDKDFTVMACGIAEVVQERVAQLGQYMVEDDCLNLVVYSMYRAIESIPERDDKWVMDKQNILNTMNITKNVLDNMMSTQSTRGYTFEYLSGVVTDSSTTATMNKAKQYYIDADKDLNQLVEKELKKLAPQKLDLTPAPNLFPTQQQLIQSGKPSSPVASTSNQPQPSGIVPIPINTLALNAITSGATTTGATTTGATGGGATTTGTTTSTTGASNQTKRPPRQTFRRTTGNRRSTARSMFGDPDDESDDSDDDNNDDDWKGNRDSGGDRRKKKKKDDEDDDPGYANYNYRTLIDSTRKSIAHRTSVYQNMIPSTMINKVKINPPEPFSGDDPKHSVADWVVEMTSYLAIAHAEERIREYVAKANLTGSARVWWRNETKMDIDIAVCDLETFFAMLVRRFTEDELVNMKVMAMQRLRQEDGKEEYFIKRFTELSDQVDTRIVPQSLRVQQFVGALTLQYQVQLLRQAPRTLEEAINMFRREIQAQKLVLELNKTRMGGSSSREVSSSSRYKPSSSSTSTSTSSRNSPPHDKPAVKRKPYVAEVSKKLAKIQSMNLYGSVNDDKGDNLLDGMNLNHLTSKHYEWYKQRACIACGKHGHMVSRCEEKTDTHGNPVEWESLTKTNKDRTNNKKKNKNNNNSNLNSIKNSSSNSKRKSNDDIEEESESSDLESDEGLNMIINEDELVVEPDYSVYSSDVNQISGVVNRNFTVCGKVNGINTHCLLDTGATTNYISERFANKFKNFTITNNKLQIISMANNEKVTTDKIVQKARVVIYDKVNYIDLVVVPRLTAEIVLGIKYMELAGIQLDIPRKGVYFVNHDDEIVTRNPINNKNCVCREVENDQYIFELIKKCQLLSKHKNNNDSSSIILTKDYINNTLYNVIDRTLLADDLTLEEGDELIELRVFDPNDETKNSDGTISTLTEEQQDEYDAAARELLEQFKDRFPDKLPYQLPPERAIDHRIELVDPNATPPTRKPMRLSVQESALLKEFITELLESKMIRPSTSPYGAPILFVKKKDGSIRLCIDYRKLNELTVKNSYGLPQQQDCIQAIRGAIIFTLLDAKSGYHQIRVHQDSIAKTAMRTKYGLYEWLVLPFGLCNAPATSMVYMNQILHHLLDVCVVVYLDDVLIYSKLLEDHKKHVAEVLQIFRDNELYANKKKCQLFKEEVVYLGVILNRDGISMEHDKVRAILDWPVPSSAEQVRSFLGMAGYYRNFIWNFSNNTINMTNNTKKNIVFNWDDKCQHEFEKLKYLISVEPVLKPFNPDLLIVIVTDASQYAIGACLMQDHGGGLQPVTFSSNKLKGAELNYSTYDKELLAIITAIKKWKCYVTGLPVEVWTDHISCKYILTQDSFQSSRQQRWVEFLLPFNIKIKYIKGSDNRVADALSRRSDHQLDSNDSINDKDENSVSVIDMIVDQAIKLKYDHICYHTYTNDIDDTELNRLELEQLIMMNEDSSSGDIIINNKLLKQIVALQKNDPVCQQVASGEINSIMKNKVPLTMVGGIIKSYGDKVYVPYDEYNSGVVTQLMMLAHDSQVGGHRGAEKTLALLHRHIYFPNMSRVVKDYISSCHVCAVTKSSTSLPSGLLNPISIPEQRWQVISMDLITNLPKSGVNQYDCILTIIDKLTKYSHIIPTYNKSNAIDISNLLYHHVIRIHGLPLSIISDRDVRFTSMVWKSIHKVMGVKLSMTSPYHAQSDGQTERINRIVEDQLRCYTNYNLNNWDGLLTACEIALNNSKQSSTGYSPYYLNYGFNPRFPLDLVFSEVSDVPKAEEYLKNIEDSNRLAKEHLEAAQQRQKLYYDNKHKHLEFKIGDNVLLNGEHLLTDVGLTKKLQQKWYGPYKVIEKIGKGAYKLELPSHSKAHPVFNVTLLKAFNESEFNFDGRDNVVLPSPPVSSEDYSNKEYEIEALLKYDGRHYYKGKKIPMYLVKYRGYDVSEAQWRPVSELKSTAADLIKKYQQHNIKMVISEYVSGEDSDGLELINKMMKADESDGDDDGIIIAEWDPLTTKIREVINYSIDSEDSDYDIDLDVSEHVIARGVPSSQQHGRGWYDIRTDRLVDSVKCIGKNRAKKDCGRFTKRGRYCQPHLLKYSDLVVKKSGIKDAGLGLFNGLETKKKGTIIAEYDGPILRSLPSLNPCTYVLELRGENHPKGPLYLNGNSTTNLGSFANDCRSVNKDAGECKGNNADLMKRPKKRMFALRANRDIKPGEEIFTSYGSDYWKNMTRYHQRLTEEEAAAPSSKRRRYKIPLEEKKQQLELDEPEEKAIPSQMAPKTGKRVGPVQAQPKAPSDNVSQPSQSEAGRNKRNRKRKTNKKK